MNERDPRTDRPSVRMESRVDLTAIDALLGSSTARGIVRALGVPRERLEELGRAGEAVREALEVADLAAEYLSPRGWIYCERAPVASYRRAVDLAAAGEASAAIDEVLVDAWNADSEAFIRLGTGPLSTLYWTGPDFEEDGWEQIGQNRERLVSLALAAHREGNYAAAIPLVLAQIDGTAADFGDAGFFGRTRAGELKTPTVDETTLAGHPANLHSFSGHLSIGGRMTECSGRLDRHAVLHGRELAYDTIANSTKCFVALAGVVEWAWPKRIEARRAYETVHGSPLPLTDDK